MDALFYYSSFFIFMLWARRIGEKISGIYLPSPDSLAALGIGKAQQAAAEARAFFFLLIFSIVLMAIVIIFLASVLKGIIWAKTTNTKITLSLLSKFLALNLAWMRFWFAIIFLISYMVKQESAPVFIGITIILSLYFTNTLYTIFMKKQKFSAIIDSIKLNVKKIHLFLLPYAVIFLSLYIILRAGRFYKSAYSEILSGLIILIYLAFARYYISSLVLEVVRD
ncbi:hypothetical protein HY310_03425 [Candidatus Microgenomates bacterium]|nr:hypothetical protein [Candidatus Microgenomates bacterium]